MEDNFNRRRFIQQAAAIGGIVGTSRVRAAEPAPVAHEPLKPIGQAKGIHPGRVVWVHDPKVLNWKGPGDGHWWEEGRTQQDRVDAMMSNAVCGLTGEDKSGSIPVTSARVRGSSWW